MKTESLMTILTSGWRSVLLNQMEEQRWRDGGEGRREVTRWRNRDGGTEGKGGKRHKDEEQ